MCAATYTPHRAGKGIDGEEGARDVETEIRKREAGRERGRVEEKK